MKTLFLIFLGINIIIAGEKEIAEEKEIQSFLKNLRSMEFKNGVDLPALNGPITVNNSPQRSEETTGSCRDFTKMSVELDKYHQKTYALFKTTERLDLVIIIGIMPDGSVTKVVIEKCSLKENESFNAKIIEYIKQWKFSESDDSVEMFMSTILHFEPTKKTIKKTYSF